MAEFLGERQIPNLREQESKKYEKDCLWFKQCMNWIKPYGNMGFQQVREFPQKLSNYRLLNSDPAVSKGLPDDVVVEPRHMPVKALLHGRHN